MKPTNGSPDAKVVIVGEAPGAEEEKCGIFFVGASGQLLFKLAAEVGLLRNDCYITNVILERPPANDVSKFITFRGKKAIPTIEYTKYEEALYDRLLETNANVYVAVGAVALYALTRQVGITKYRGSILAGNIRGKKIKVIPILHPAAALRQYLFTRLILFDLKRVVEEMHTPDINLPEPNLITAPSFDVAIEYLEYLNKCNQVVFDIEVFSGEVCCISLGSSPNEAISIPFLHFADDTKVLENYYSLEHEAILWLKICEILENPNITKIGQNIIFDITFLHNRFGIVPQGPIEDTMVAQGIAYPDYPKGLDFITSIYTRMPYYKDEGKQWLLRDIFAWSSLWTYNAKDSIACIDALPKLKRDLETMNNLDIYYHQCRLILPLVYMQERGIKLDVVGLKKESTRVAHEIEQLKNQLREVAGCELNPKSSKQIQEYFYSKKGEKPYVNRKTGKPTADSTAIKRLSRKGYQEASIIQQITALSYMKSHFLDVEYDADCRLRCAFNPVGTDTGRISSSRSLFGTGTNMQNLPMEFRKYLIADEDNIMFNMDLSMAENRIVAYVAPEPNMINAFEKGIDLHKQTASLIFSKPIDEISDEPGSATIGGGKFSERAWGKRANHGLNYDLSYRTFGLMYEISEQDAKTIVEMYHKVYPGVRQYHANIRYQLSKNRTIENLMGRKRLFLDRWGDELFKSAYSFIPQSTVADIINIRGVNYIYYNQAIFKPIDLLLQVHDSIVFQVNYKIYSWAQIAECLVKIKESLETPLHCRGYTFSIPTSIEVGFNLNKKAMVEVDKNATATVSGLARELSKIYEQLRASVSV